MCSSVLAENPPDRCPGVTLLLIEYRFESCQSASLGLLKETQVAARKLRRRGARMPSFIQFKISVPS